MIQTFSSLVLQLLPRSFQSPFFIAIAFAWQPALSIAKGRNPFIGCAAIEQIEIIS